MNEPTLKQFFWDEMVEGEPLALKIGWAIPLLCIAFLVAMLGGMIVLGVLELFGLYHFGTDHTGQHCIVQNLVHHSAKAGGDRWECVKWAKN